MPVLASTAPLVVPAVTVERLEIPHVVLLGFDDPPGLGVTVETTLSPTARRATDPSPDAGWLPATWLTAGTVRTHLISGQAPGEYGVWARFIVEDEAVVRYAGRVVLV